VKALAPLHMDEGVIDGGLAVKNGEVSGWTCSRGTVPVTKPVTLTDQDGIVVLSLPNRLDLNDADMLFRPARYSAVSPAFRRCGAVSDRRRACHGDVVRYRRPFGRVQPEGACRWGSTPATRMAACGPYIMAAS
jgi:hypothetical protein